MVDASLLNGSAGIKVFLDFFLRPDSYWVRSDEAISFILGTVSSRGPSPRFQPIFGKCDPVTENTILEIQQIISPTTPNASGGATGAGGGGSGGFARTAGLRGLAAGEVVAGFVDRGDLTPFHAFRWTEGAGAVDLGTLDPANNASRTSMATDISADGSVVVGFSQINASATQHAFRWISSGMVDLGAPAGAARDSRALAVNDAGDVLVGDGTFADQNTISGFRSGAFRWTQAGGYQNLGALEPGFFSVATEVSGDGTVIVGQGGVQIVVGGSSVNGSRAFRWTNATGMQPIGPLPGHAAAMATGVSDNGKVVVGISAQGGALSYNLVLGHGVGTAFRWTETGGIQDLRQLLVTAGLDLTGIQLVAATGVSPDGQWIVGNAVTQTTPAGETRPFLVKYCDAAIGGTCTPYRPAPVATFELASGSTSASVVAGGSITATLTVTPSGGFNQGVSFSCSGLPEQSSCSFAPASLTPNAAAISTTLTIATTAPSQGTSVFSVPSERTLAFATVGAGVLAFVVLLLMGARGGRISWARPVLAGLAALLVLDSCGGDGGTDPPPSGGTPAGTFPVVVSATSGSGASAVTKTVTISLTVTR